MKSTFLPLLLTFGLLGMSHQGVAQCEACTPDLTCVAVDFPVLCPEQLPNAVQGEPYAATATFNLPPAVVDPGSGLEASLLTVTISSVTGLPFGLEFAPNNPDGVYNPGNGEYYGCSSVCGVPLVSGSFFVEISVVVLVSAFGFEQVVNESFSLPLVVEPGENGGSNASFSLSASQGCAPLTVQGTNLITDAGATYAWDFGNGENSAAMNPSFTYTSPGTYNVSLETVVNELSLTSVNITSLGGGWSGDVEDFFGLAAPDPYFVLSGPQGGIYTSAYVDGNETPNINGFNIVLDAGTTYNIAFYDADGPFTSDDFLGSSDFTPSGAGSLTVSNSTTAILNLVESQLASFNESAQVLVFDGLEVYEDLDGDGYGNPEVPVNACDPNNVLPYAFNDQDCDDTNAAIYFGAPGSGDNVDNDCDGTIDGSEVEIITGCLDNAACNFNAGATVDDGSCAFPETNFDCDGNCLLAVDCEGNCGGSAVEDDCGVCNGDNSTCDGPACVGDLNSDLLVSVADILVMLGEFGCINDCINDLSGDGAISVDDLLSLLANFGIDCNND